MSVGRFLQQAAAGNAGSAVYVDDIFSATLYEGTSSSGGVITTGVDANTDGGMVLIKNRTTSGTNWQLFDTERSNGYQMPLNSTDNGGNLTVASGSTPFIRTDGIEFQGNHNYVNQSGANHVAYTFKRQAKFFDLVKYTGNGTAGHEISHNLGSVPGSIWVKRTDGANDWFFYHRVMGGTKYLKLNTNGRDSTSSVIFNNTDPTNTKFTVGTNAGVNTNGAEYMAYLFAHDEQEFGEDSDKPAIYCGSYTGNGGANGPEVNVGFEPQWILIKSQTESSTNWYMFDSSRGISQGRNDYFLRTNLDNNETSDEIISLTPTGFKIDGAGYPYNRSLYTYLFIAIARPHKPASEFAATNLFDVIARSGTGSATTIDNINFAPDAFLTKRRNGTQHWPFSARLTGDKYIYLSDSSAEGVPKHVNGANGWGYQDKIAVTADADVNASGGTYINYFFKRAKGFFDVVTYTGDGSTQTINHNLGVVPEIILFRGRAAEAWWMYSAEMAATEFLVTYLNNAKYTGQTYFNSTRPTATSWDVKGPSSAVNGNGDKYIAYLFASVPGIAKFGSYTGNGTTTNNIDCGFSSGARFVVVKRIDSTGNWYVWDTERGIVAGNDPKLYFSSTGSEITSADEIDPYSAGFTISSSSGAINASGGTYLFFAIA